ncbi:UNVERIFIED_CONTAM: hypothetical protein HDU68_005365 [Siphonaria sp. JEL0065]|nr:hypothetical protein HDU68_005365 [Siphonaria sp. JEL0065]
MDVIEVDGEHVQPMRANAIDIGSGQRYSILVKARELGNGEDLVYNFRLSMHTSAFVKPQNTLTLVKLMYTNNTASKNAYTPTKIHTKGDLDESQLITTSQTPLLIPTKQFILGFTGGTNLGFNQTQYSAPQVPTLYTALSIGSSQFGNDPQGYGDVNPLVIENLNDVVELVIVSKDADPHPVHLHGHRFQVVYASKKEEDFVPSKKYPVAEFPVMRDTVMIPPHGYIVLRFRADTPGAWLMHCHLPMHSDLGMAVTFIEAPKEMSHFKIPPANLALCSYKRSISLGNTL